MSELATNPGINNKQFISTSVKTSLFCADCREKITVAMKENSFRFNRDVKQALDRHFKTPGFVLLEEDAITLYKEEENYTDFISVFTGIDIITGQYNFLAEAGRKLKRIDQYWEEYRIEPLKLKKRSSYTISGVVKEHNKNISFTQFPKDISEPGEMAAVKVKEYWNELFLPRLNKYSDIHELNKSENASFEKGTLLNLDGFWVCKIIIARLAEDPRYEELYQYIRDMHVKFNKENPDYAEYFRNYLWVIEKVYEKLKTVQPLKNPDLRQNA